MMSRIRSCNTAHGPTGKLYGTVLPANPHYYGHYFANEYIYVRGTALYAKIRAPRATWTLINAQLP